MCQESMNEVKLDKEITLAEYQAAQETAHHVDVVIWEAAAIIWSANALLLGFILEAWNSAKPSTYFLILLGAMLGLGMTRFLMLSFGRLKATQLLSFGVCQKIEKQLPMYFCLHSKIDAAYEEAHDKGRMRQRYNYVSALFLAVWFIVSLASLFEFLRYYVCPHIR